MLTLIRELTSPLLAYIKDDPVRPEIPAELRVGKTKFVSSITEDGEHPKAIVCVSLHDFVPTSVNDLEKEPENPTTAIFYTIWSYAPGAGSQLIFETVDEIKRLFPTVERFITLSPKTEMARKFHHKNGAITLQENTDTINYEYLQTR